MTQLQRMRKRLRGLSAYTGEAYPLDGTEGKNESLSDVVTELVALTDMLVVFLQEQSNNK